MLLKSYKYRLYPTKKQKILIEKHFGAHRFIYNLALETKQYAWNWHKVRLGGYDLVRQITELKKDAVWLSEISIISLQQAVLDMESAYNNFLKGTSKYVKFKNKHGKQSFRNNVNIKSLFNKNIIKIPKFQEGIKCIFDRTFDGKIKSATVSKTKTNKYYISILVEDNADVIPTKPIKEETSIGIDLGLKDFAVISTGEAIPNMRFYKNNLIRLKVLQKRAARKKKGSNNRKKANLRVASQYEKITNRKNDFLHKLSKRLIDENQGGTICLESLNIKGMIKNRRLSQAIYYVGWREFVRQLKYKGNWYGVNILQIDRFAPSSKTCTCGYVNNDLTLKDREWTCPKCGAKHNRDLLAANNIKKFALQEYSGQGMSAEPAESLTLVGAMKQEGLINNNFKT